VKHFQDPIIRESKTLHFQLFSIA